MFWFVLLLATLTLVVGDQCTSHVLTAGNDAGTYGKGCVNLGCCEYSLHISELCAGSQVCCFSRNTCPGTSSTHIAANLDCHNFGHNIHHARGAAYYPDISNLEGGLTDMRGNRLRTLQDFLAGNADYVSVAMDSHAGIPYGTPLCIPEINREYNRVIVFKVVDTGAAFSGKGYSRIDVCVADVQASYDIFINGELTLVFQ